MIARGHQQHRLLRNVAHLSGYNRLVMASHRHRSFWWVWWILVFCGFTLASIVLAWVCAIWSPVTNPTEVSRPGSDHPLAQALLQYDDFDTFTVHRASGFGWQRERIVARRPTIPGTHGTLHRVGAGWPLHCMEGHWRRFEGHAGDEYIAQLPEWPGVQRNASPRIPLRPMWAAVLLNAVLLGLPLHLAFAYYGMRRTLRRRRGQCVHCGYDLRNSPQQRCSECGALFRAQD